jgi:predicted DNA-binding transcriptional regulator AlpA
MKTQRGPAPVPATARFISAPQVCDRYGGRSHMWLERKLQNDPKFPRPKCFGSRVRFFDLRELESYERSCAADQTEAVA